MSMPQIDTSAWPIVLITYPGPGTLIETRLFIEKLAPIYQRGMSEPFVSINDLRLLAQSKVLPEVRSSLNSGVNELLAAYPGSKIGEARVVPTLALRAAHAAANMTRRCPFPMAVFTKVEDARRWGQQLVGARRKQ